VRLAAILGHPAAQAAWARSSDAAPGSKSREISRLDEAWARSLLAIAGCCPHPEHPDVRIRLDPLEAFVSCPCREHASALQQVENPRYPSGAVRGSAKVARLALQEARSSDPLRFFEDPDPFEELIELVADAWAQADGSEGEHTVDAVRAAVCRQVVPWLFGLADPVAGRVR